MKDQESARAILSENIYGTVATTTEDGAPWGVPQFMVYDNEVKTVYWCAARASQHGKNIASNGKAFVVVYDSSVGPGEGSGVYLQTDASIVTDPAELETAMAKLIARHAGVPYWSHEDVSRPDALVAIFKAEVRQAWVNKGREENGQFVLYRETVEL